MKVSTKRRSHLIPFLGGFTICIIFLSVHPIHSILYGREVQDVGDIDHEDTNIGFLGFFISTVISPTIDIDVTPSSYKGHEIISVAPPVPEYGVPVYSAQLFNHTFGNSYGSPYVGQWDPPGVDFNRIIVTLKTSIDHSQYDRLAHFHVNGSEVWRTSTIEPGGVLAYSIFSKDVSRYNSLFQNPTSFLFQLDNVVEAGILGEFTTVLTADFYLVSDEFNLLGIERPPDSVYSLTEQGLNKPPLINLVESPYTVKIPKISPQTSRLILSVITSGNANEEFWYDNELGPGQSGPIRIVNVYYDGQKIAVQAPEPVIFTGGISPLFWNPVVSTDAFNLPTIDIDLTALLPDLGLCDHTLSIQVSNGIGEWQNTSTLVGYDWITAANLLAWEDSTITSVSGVVGKPYGSTSGRLVSDTVNAEEFQVIDSRHYGGISSQVVYNFVGGGNFTVTASISSSALTVNSQTNFNTSAIVAQYGKTINSATISTDGLIISEFTFKGIYPLTLGDYYVPTNNASISESINDIYHVKGVSISGDRQSELSVRQNGTSQFQLAKYVIGGDGYLTTNYQYSENYGVTSNREVYGGAASVRAIGQISSDDSWITPAVVPDPLLSIDNFIQETWELLGDLSRFGDSVEVAQLILDDVESAY